MTTQCDAILEILRAAAGEWVPMPYLARASESLNIHTRVDELRHKRGLNIQTKTERDAERKHRKASFYRLPVEA
jgi:hypothetical protein